MQSLKLRYVIGALLPKLRDYIEEGSFLKQSATSSRILHWVLGTIKLEAGDVLKNDFFLVVAQDNDKTHFAL